MVPPTPPRGAGGWLPRAARASGWEVCEEAPCHANRADGNPGPGLKGKPSCSPHLVQAQPRGLGHWLVPSKGPGFSLKWAGRRSCIGHLRWFEGLFYVSAHCNLLVTGPSPSSEPEPQGCRFPVPESRTVLLHPLNCHWGEPSAGVPWYKTICLCLYPGVTESSRHSCMREESGLK